MIAGIPGIRDLSMTTNGILLTQFSSELSKAGLQRVNISLDTTDPEKYASMTRGGNIERVFEGINAALDAGLVPVKLNCVVQYTSSEEDALMVKEFATRNGLQVRFIRQMDLATGQYSVVEGGEGGHCAICNRLRLTANGLVKPCLFNAIGYSVRELGARQALLKAIANKPACGSVNYEEKFYMIGG